MQNVSYNKSVFVNFPFDPVGSLYDKLFKALIFTVKDCGFEPRCALEREDGSEERLKKIVEIIEESQFAIHDISHTRLYKGFPRFNMPFEVGLFVGAKKFGGFSKHTSKSCLIFEKNKNDYDCYFSDLSGNDNIKHHNMKINVVIETARDWLSGVTQEMTPGSEAIIERYRKFHDELPEICSVNRWNLKKLHYIDYCKAIALWIKLQSV